MARHLDNRLWLLLVALAVTVTVACSSSSTPSGGEENDGSSPGEPVSDAMTQG
jgi:hypothetical protein